MNAFKHLQTGNKMRKAISVLMTLMLTAGLFCAYPFAGQSAYAASTDATGQINADGGAYMRSGASTTSGKVTLLKDNTKVTIVKEVFVKKSSTKKTDRWYYISTGGKKGYVRADLIDNIKYANVSAKTTDVLNYRVGAGTGMTKKGTLKKGKAVTILLPASQNGQKGTWYKAKIGNSEYYISGDYVKIDSAPAQQPAEETDQQKDPQPAETQQTTESAQTTTPQTNQTQQSTQTQTQQNQTQQQTQPVQQQPAGNATITISGTTKPGVLYTGQSFTIKGTIKSDQTITSVTAGVTDETGNWVISDTAADVNKNTYNLQGVDRNIKFGKLKSGNYKYRVDVYTGNVCYTKMDEAFKVIPSEVAAKLSNTATTGGSARIIYTFNTKNCTKLFSVSGYGSAKVPQGMAYADGKYYIVFGMSGSQAIVTFSSTGKRLASTKYGYNMGHPNAMTYDPVTKVCYIFRGSQYKVHVWNPVTNKFGNMKLSYSNSGIAYDNVTGELYCTSKTGVRVYSADGKFTHKKLFLRCTHTGTTYVQDCGASRGYIFHAVSGSNKHGTNYLDVYRASDGKYLGTINIQIDETESVIVDDNGFVCLLVNTKKTTDYVYKTPLNVNDLP